MNDFQGLALEMDQILYTAPVLLMTRDKRGKILRISVHSGRQLGTNRHKAFGNSLADFVDAADAEQFRKEDRAFFWRMTGRNILLRCWQSPACGNRAGWIVTGLFQRQIPIRAKPCIRSQWVSTIWSKHGDRPMP